MIDRRSFLLISASAIASQLYATSKKLNTLTMNGDLDDDLFLIKSTPSDNTMTNCYQMHNPKKNFIYEGKGIPSTPIYGTIDFKSNFMLKHNEILTVYVANEREEFFDAPKLNARTHFKAVSFNMDGKSLIPPLIPENNDVPNYPVWFGDENVACTIDETKSKDYNYYKLWENAVCGVGIILPESGSVIIELYNEDNEKMFTFNNNIDSTPKNLVSNEIKFNGFEKHVLAEVDGHVFSSDNTMETDEYIKKNAITKMVVNYSSKTFQITLPYPLPYPNRIYGVSI